MIRERQAEASFHFGTYKKHKHVYYIECDKHPTIDEILNANELKLGLSEWWDFLRDRQQFLIDELKVKHVIPIITYEECVSCGL
jgi:hypothetical protein